MKYPQTSFLFSLILVLAMVSCLFIEEISAGKGKGEDIILYNGNIVVRNGKGKKGGSIVVANSGGGGESMDMMPYDMWSGFGRRR